MMRIRSKRLIILLLILVVFFPPFQNITAKAESVEDSVDLIGYPFEGEIISKADEKIPQKLKAISVSGVVYQPKWLEKIKVKENQGKKRIYTYTHKDLEELILHGATEEDIYLSDLMGNELSIPPRELFELKKSSNQTWSDFEKNLKSTKNGHMISMEQTNEYSSVSEVTYEINDSSVLNDVYNSGTGMAENGNLIQSLSALYALDTNSVYNGLISQMQINQTNKPQFSDQNGLSEIVDPASGKLVWKKTDISLPGRDGLDLNIGVMFDSNNAFPYMKYYNGNNVLQKSNYLISRYDLGMGWSFMFPSVQIADGGYMYYHHGDGAIYRVDLNATDAVGSYTHLVGYEGKNERFVQDTQGLYTNGQATSAYYMEYADKKREYFAADGRLLGIVDRYGNTLKFQHIDRTTYDGQSHKVISSITDTVGRVVTFAYETNLQTAPETTGEGITVTVQDPNGIQSQQVVYMKNKAALEINGQADGYVPALWYIQNQANEITRFGYINEAYTNFDYLRKQNSPPYSGMNFSTLLGAVIYPRSVTWYQYQKYQSNLGDSGFTDEYRVTSRKDTLFKYDAASGQYGTSAIAQGYNQMNYSYTGSYTGYTGTYGAPGNYNYSTSSIVQSSSAMGGLTTTTQFNQDGQILSETTRASNGERKVVTNQSFDTTYKTKPVQTMLSEYGSDSDNSPNQLYTEMKYTDWGGILNETKPLTWNQFNDSSIKTKYTTSYTYDPTYYFIKTKSWYQNQSDTSPLIEQYGYFADGRLKSLTNAKQETTTYCYTAVDTSNKTTSNCTNSDAIVTGKISTVKETKNLGNGQQQNTVTNYLASTNYAYPEQIVSTFMTKNNAGQDYTESLTINMTYDLGTGWLRTKKDGNGNVTSYVYDSLGRIKRTTYPSFTNSNNVKYDVSDEYVYTYSNTPSDIDPQNSGIYNLAVNTYRKYTQQSTGQVTILSNEIGYYDGLGFLMYDAKMNNGQVQTSQYRKDDLGRAIYSVDPMGNTMSSTFDAWGNQQEVMDAYGNLYVSQSKLKSRQSIHYFVAAEDAASYHGNPNQNNLKSSYAEQDYDQWGQLITNRVYKDWPNTTQPSTELFTYDISGNMVSYTDPKRNLNGEGVTKKYYYDALNQLLAVKNALNEVTKYQYDANGQIVSTSIQNNVINTKTYNELGSITTKTDPSTNQSLFVYNNLGLLKQMTDRNGSQFNYQYDQQNRLINQAVTGTAGETQQKKIILGSNGILIDTVETYKNSTKTSAVLTQMDDLKRLVSIQVQGANNSFTANLGLGYDKDNRITTLSSSNGTSGAFNTQYKYDKTRLNKVQVDGLSTPNNSDSSNVKYNYYPNGQLKSISYPPLTDGSILITEYTYDGLNRVRNVTNKKGTTVLSSSSYTYDDNGNISTLSQSMINQPIQTKTYDYDKLNRLISISRSDESSASYTYDAQGNRLTQSDSGNAFAITVDVTYKYDLYNTLVGVTDSSGSTTFDYAADGMRYKKTSGTNVVQYRYDQNQQVIAEVDGNNNTIANYVRGDRLLVKKDVASSKDYFYLYNGHGDVIQIVDASGKVVNSYNYDEWGNINQQTEGITNIFKYTGEVYDNETGLYYLRARYYDQSMGRFINEDTYEGQIDNPLSLNLYTYVHNNPLIYTDPTGHWLSSDKFLSANDQKAIMEATTAFNNAQKVHNIAGMQAAHDQALAIRWASGKYEVLKRTDYSTGTTTNFDGNVGGVKEDWLSIVAAIPALAAGIVYAPAALAAADVATMGYSTSGIATGTVVAGKSIGFFSSLFGPKTTKLYRSVSEAELAGINTTKAFDEGYNMSGKWMATTFDDAVAWGQKMDGGNTRIISIQLQQSFVNGLHYQAKLDGIGPAYYAEVDALNAAFIKVTVVK